VKTQQLITNALHRSKLDLRANVSFCDFIYIYQVHKKKYYFNKYNTKLLLYICYPNLLHDK